MYFDTQQGMLWELVFLLVNRQIIECFSNIALSAFIVSVIEIFIAIANPLLLTFLNSLPARYLQTSLPEKLYIPGYPAQFYIVP